MKKSLLGHLYSHIKGSAEDVATMSLQYLLTYYDCLKISFNGLLADRLGVPFDKQTSYECQSVGEELERPDMAGTDSNGKEIILCEAKFYAGLTENQPLTYLKRLRMENGTGLVFICPKDRMISLWATLMDKCKDQNTVQINDFCVSVNNIHMTILSWEEIISNLNRTADAVEQGALADIEQLRGYCEQIISNSFQPFKSEELGADMAKRYEQLMYILDRAWDAIVADKGIEADMNGLRTTAHRHGYKRYCNLNGLEGDICLDLELWANDKYEDTPYWIGFRDKEWKKNNLGNVAVSTVPVTRKFFNRSGFIYLAIDVPCGLVEDDAIESVRRQIAEYLQLFDGGNSKAEKQEV